MKRLFFLGLILLSISSVTGQTISPWRYDPSAKDVSLWYLRRYEISFGVGLTQIFGDIGGFSSNANILGFKDLTYRQTRINFNPSLKYKITKEITARASLSTGYFHTIDERGSNVRRGFESSTLFIEPSLVGEYHFLVSTINRKQLRSKRLINDRSILAKVDVYGFSGLGLVSYTVLPNDKLESFIINKSGLAAVIPVGIGANLIYSRTFNLGLEIGGRYAFTDKLEGYSSQYSKFNDCYYLINFVLTYKIRLSAN